MSTLWTPDGEHYVPRPGEGGSGESAPPGDPGSGRGATKPDREESDARRAASEEELEAEEDLSEVARRLAAAPAEDVVANHCYGLFELAALHLSLQPPQLDQARLAIDALGLVVDGLGDRLGPHAGPLADGLSQLRLAFVKIAAAAPASDG